MNILSGLILKEGWRYIEYTVVALMFFVLLDLELFAFLAFVSAVLLLWMYHNPSRQCRQFDRKSVVAPCDGYVRSIKSNEDGSGFVIEVETGYFDAHALRAPIDGKVETVSLVRGAQLGEQNSLFSLLNETAELRFVNEEGDALFVRHRLLKGIVPLSLETNEGEYLVKGLQYGIMLHGITELYFPKEARIAVNVGERIHATETLVGYLG